MSRISIPVPVTASASASASAPAPRQLPVEVNVSDALLEAVGQAVYDAVEGPDAANNCNRFKTNPERYLTEQASSSATAAELQSILDANRFVVLVDADPIAQASPTYKAQRLVHLPIPATVKTAGEIGQPGSPTFQDYVRQLGIITMMGCRP